MKKIILAVRIVSSIVIAILLFFTIVNIYLYYNYNVLNNKTATFLGYSYQIGQNSSMEPTLSTNDFLITKKQDCYELNDIVTFKREDSHLFTTHRIIEITKNGYITKGDNNLTTLDPEIKSDEILGKVVVVVPFLGAIVRIVNNPLGFILIMAIIIVGVILIKSMKRE